MNDSNSDEFYVGYLPRAPRHTARQVRYFCLALLACLIVAKQLRGSKLGTAAICAVCVELQSRGFDRVIAEWVASVALYERVGFRIWRVGSLAGAN